MALVPPTSPSAISRACSWMAANRSRSAAIRLPATCSARRAATPIHYRAAGFDVLSLANNHARDFGEDGRNATMQALAAAGIHHSGREGDFASFRQRASGLRCSPTRVTKTPTCCSTTRFRADGARTGGDARYRHRLVSRRRGRRATERLPFADEEYYGEPRGDVVGFARMVSTPAPTSSSVTGRMSCAPWSSTGTD